MKQNPSASVAYDHRSFIINGQRTLLISGEVHYARSPRELWPVLLDRSAECGLNCIAAYIFWNFHEPWRDDFDFSGERDLGHFLSLCAGAPTARHAANGALLLRGMELRRSQTILGDSGRVANGHEDPVPR